MGWIVNCTSCFLKRSLPCDVVNILQLKSDVARFNTENVEENERKKRNVLSGSEKFLILARDSN